MRQHIRFGRENGAIRAIYYPFRYNFLNLRISHWTFPWMLQRFAPIVAPDAPDGIVIDSTGTEHLPPTARSGVGLTRSGSPPTSSSPTTDRRSQSPGHRSGRLIHLVCVLRCRPAVQRRDDVVQPPQ
jgi:hypothetical protein